MSLADRIAGLPGSSSAGKNSRPRGPQRTASGSGKQHRPAPYVKSPAPASSSTASGLKSPPARPGNVQGQWEHDLFNPLSDLYNPQLNTAALTNRPKSRGQGVFGKALDGLAAKPSPSLRPFGMNTPPLTSPPLSTSIPQSNDLFGRLSSSADASVAAPSPVASSDERRERQRQIAMAEQAAREKENQRRALRQQQEAEEREKLLRAAELEQLATRQQEEEEARARAEAANLQRQLQQRQAQMAQQQRQSGTTVTVKNLVDGTTPEDVKAAFADFGNILECKVLGSNGETLDMQVVFSQLEDAKVAVQKLNGVLADGHTLELKIVEPAAPQGLNLKGSRNRQASGQVLPALNSGHHGMSRDQATLHNPSSSRNATASSDRQNGASTRPPVARSTDVDMQADPPGASRRMRADQVAQFDPRAVVQEQPSSQRMVGRNDRASPSNRGRSRGQPASRADNSRNGGSSLLSRLGGGAGDSRHSRRSDDMVMD